MSCFGAGDRAVLLVAGACVGLLACSGADTRAPAKPATPVPAVTAQRVSAAQVAEPAAETDAARHARQAADFEARGVLDRAAESWRLSHQASPDPAKLTRAATLFESSLATHSAHEVYVELARLQGSSKQVAAPEDPAEPTQTELDVMAKQVSEARDRVRLGDLLGARARLSEEALARSPEAWALLGAIHWRLGKHELAQRAWSKARSIAGSYLTLTQRLEVVPPLDIAPVDFNATAVGILFAAANRRMFTYEPNLETFGALDASLDGLEGAVVQSAQLAELWTMPSAEYGEPFGKPLEAQAAGSGRLLAWRDGAENLKLLSIAHELGEVKLEWSKPVGAPPEGDTPWSPRSERRLGVCFSADERTLFAGTRDGEIVAFDERGAQRFRWLAHEGKSVTLLAASPDGKWLASAGLDGMIRIWELARRKLVESIGPEREVRTLAFFPDSDSLEFSRAWELTRMNWRSKAEVGSYQRGVEILRVDHSADARWTAIGHDKTDSIQLLRGRRLEPEPLHPRQVWSTIAAASADGSTLVTSTSVGSTLFDMASWRSRPLAGPAMALAISGDGGRVALAHETELAVYDAKSGEVVSRLAVEPDRLTQLLFLGAGELLVSGEHSTIYDLKTSLPQFEPAGVTRYLPLATGSLRDGPSGWERHDLRGESVARLDCADRSVSTNAARTHFTCSTREAGLRVYAADGALVHTLEIGADPELVALSDDHQRATVVIYPGLVYTGDFAQGRWQPSSDELHRGLAGVRSLSYVGARWQMLAGSDGIYFVHADDATQWGGLHFLTSGSWFALTSSSMQQHTDGDPMGIDATAVFPPSGVSGTVFEFMRTEGALALLLAEKLPGQAAH